MARRGRTSPELANAAGRARAAVRRELKAAKGTGDYSGVRQAILDFLLSTIDPE